MNKFTFRVNNVNYTLKWLEPNTIEIWNDKTGQYEAKRFPNKNSAKYYYLAEFKRFLNIK